MTDTHHPDGRAPSPPVLPVADLKSARPYLEAPFPPESVGFLARKLNDSLANVFAFLSIDDVELRLTVVVGLDNWRFGKPEVLDPRHLTCRLTVFGETQTDLGEGEDRRDQYANGGKRCARHFGVGRYLKPRFLKPRRLPIGNGPGHVPTNRKGHLYVPDQLLPKLRQAYAQDLERIARIFGPPLIYSPQPWSVPGPAASVRNGTPALNGVVGLSPGERVRRAAAELGLNTAQLANAILTAAGAPPRGPSEAAAVLERMLERIPADIAARVLDTFAGQASTANGATRTLPAATPPAEPLDGGTVTIDFAALGPATEREAA